MEDMPIVNGIDGSNAEQTDYPTIRTTEMHTAGDPVRIIESGYPVIPGSTIMEKLRYAKQNLDHLRKFVMREPRGHYDMYGVVKVAPSAGSGADMAVLFIDNGGYSTMCGHCTLAMARYGVDRGYVKKNTETKETAISIECPCGLVKAYVKRETGEARFISVPAFVFKTDVMIEMERFGAITVDISYGGAFYAIVTADVFGIDLKTAKYEHIVEIADEIKEIIKAQVPLHHPDNPDLAFLYGVIITDGKDTFTEQPTAQFVMYADNQVCRSPCGSGTTSRMALMYHKGLTGIKQMRKFESATTGSVFTGMVVDEVTIGEFSGVTVQISGRGFYAGKSEFTLENDDELGKGFLVK